MPTPRSSSSSSGCRLGRRVRRDGKWVELPAAMLVPGDVVQLSLGVLVPGDVRIVEGSILLDQSMLTGESMPVEAAPGKTAYAGALVRRGEAMALVTGTGSSTYYGRAAELVRVAHVESTRNQSGAQPRAQFSIINAVLLVGLVAYADAIGMRTAQIIPLVLTALLSAVPVALPATFTLGAALGARTIALKGVLLTRLSALHEAAMIDVLCVDKTGTLTENELAVAAVRPLAEGWTVGDVLAFAALAAPRMDRIRSMPRSASRRWQLRRDARIPALTGFTPFDPVSKRSEAIAKDTGSARAPDQQGGAGRNRVASATDAGDHEELESLADTGYRCWRSRLASWGR